MKVVLARWGAAVQTCIMLGTLLEARFYSFAIFGPLFRSRDADAA